jgi:hypothetical protein
MLGAQDKPPDRIPGRGVCLAIRRRTGVGSAADRPLHDYMNDGISGASIWTT